LIELHSRKVATMKHLARHSRNRKSECLAQSMS
jgi:hypothetical protein